MRDDIKALWAEIYKSDQYKEFKRDVRKRDNYTCQKCNSRGTVNRKNRLHVHHKKPKGIAEFFEFVFIPENGIVLCNKCHIQEHRDMAEKEKGLPDKPHTSKEQLLGLIATLTFKIRDSYTKRRRKRYAYRNKKSRGVKRR